jgi:hypothetical protein
MRGPAEDGQAGVHERVGCQDGGKGQCGQTCGCGEGCDQSPDHGVVAYPGPGRVDGLR